MTNNFQSLSKEVANDFIQNIVFIDDKAYQPQNDDDPRHDLNAEEISREFAKSNKICSIYRPTSQSDIELLSDVIHKADATVIDWEILIPDSVQSDTGSDEEDEEDEELKGTYTKQLIIKLLDTPFKRNSLKLIVIYTGETDLPGIGEDILTDLHQNEIADFSISERDSCTLESPYCKIIIRAKNNGGENRGKYVPALRDKRLTYEEIPNFISNEFSKMTDGLLPNFALQSLSAVRKNSHQIINIFSKKLDAAYITNKSLLVNTDDANELLVDLMGDTFTSILRANNLNDVVNEEFVDLWLDENLVESSKPTYDKKGKKAIPTYTLTKDIVKKLLKSSDDVEKKYSEVLSGNTEISKSSIQEKNNFKKYAFDLFHDEEEQETVHTGFTNLCQHKNLIHHEEYVPILTLGSVIKSTIGDSSYFVCIQQRCDSVRIKPEDTRRFLFISLSTYSNGKKFDFIAPDGTKLCLDKKTFNLRTVKFNGSEDGTVQSVCEDGKYYFKQVHESEQQAEKFEFLFELKDLYAQRVVADYSSSLSRVGLDEPEWVRLS